MALRRLVYVSRARIKSPAQVRVLIGQAQVRNRQSDVTGALGYTGRHFIQVLEGKPETVEEVIRSIGRDTRHTAVRLLIDRVATRRVFSQWDMHLVESLDAADAIEALVEGPEPTGQVDLRALYRHLSATRA